MKIKKIEIYKLNVPLKEPFIISLGTITTANSIVLKIYTDQGIYGTGEGNPYMFIVGETQEADFEYAKMLSKLMLNKNPLEIEDRLAEIDRILKFNPTIKSAFDIALYDIMGKYSGLPLFQLWGGTNNREIITDMTVSIDTPEKMVKDALKFKNAGFPAIKVKLGDNLKNDVARIAAIREAIGYEIPLRIDANQGWDTVTAINTLNALAKYNIEHCEAPIPRWNVSDLPYVREHSPIAIMADESLFNHHDAYRLVHTKACDYFNIKLSKSGGLNNALKIVSIAEAAGIKSQVGCMSETRFGLTGLMHLVIARKNIVHFDLDSALMLADDPVTGGIEYKEKGRVTLKGDLPGIGADFDQKYLDKMEKFVIR
jgi:L-alanine-DL-glutamate epimerase-like enolase superfamily enzyme